MVADRSFPQVRRLRDPGALREHLAGLGVSLALDDAVTTGVDAPLGAPATFVDGSAGPRRIGNRFAVLPMEGWDADRDGRPTELVRRRWRRFGASGAKLVWGEATAVRADGRANPNQLVIGAHTVDALRALRTELVAEHTDRFGTADDLVVGLQLTHSGRWSRPDGIPAPRVAYRHPVLDARVGLDAPGVGDDAVLTDDELDDLVGCFVDAAALAARAGFDFVDVKHCHGYLGHELLSAWDRPGRYGGDLTGRTRLLREVVAGIRERSPDLAIACRFSAFDAVPHRPGPDGTGEPEVAAGYRHAFGGTGPGPHPDGGDGDEGEAAAFVDLLAGLGVGLVCVTAGSPYYVPHVQRPAYYPPSDGYLPPEDPLVGVARLVEATAALCGRHDGVLTVGSGYSYLQEWLAHVAQAQVRAGRVDVVGLGRMVLSYPDLAADVLAGSGLDRRRICRTFSDCTTAPRQGLVSGCYPLDEFYKSRPERATLVAAKRAAGRAGEET